MESKHVPARQTVQFTVGILRVPILNSEVCMSVEIAFRSTGSVSDFFVTPDGISGRLHKTSVPDISVARASAATPTGHLTVSVPLYSKWHETHKGVHHSSCCELFANQVLDQVPGLWSSEQVRDLETESRQDE